MRWKGPKVNKTKPRGKPVPREAIAQQYIVARLDALNEFYRVGIEGARLHPATARKMALQGMRKGWPDFHFPLRRLWIELKIKPNGASDEQKACHERIRLCGDRVEIVTATGPEDAWQQVQDILCTATHKAVDIGGKV